MSTTTPPAVASENLKSERQRKALRSLHIQVVFGVLLTSCAVATLLFSLLTFFQAKEKARQWIVKPFCKALLALVGIRVRDLRTTVPEGPCIYISNHLSALDIFIICGLGIPRTRYFLSVSTLRVVPMAIVGLCTGVFYIAEQSEPHKRTACFKRAERILKATGESVYLSPEGFRNSGLELQKFNRGAFHMATNLKRPIVALLIETPKECHAGFGLFFWPGEVTVRQIALIDTSRWQESQIHLNREATREIYLKAMQQPFFQAPEGARAFREQRET